MAGFSLGGGAALGQQQQQENQENNQESLFLYSGASSRGFELWHQQQQVGPNHPHQHLYSATPGMLRFSDESTAFPGGSRSMRGSSGGMSCQDCGNQAKKDCSHMRCRTCCKSRGFPCSTHVKSTWVPASKRRERQQQLVSSAAAGFQRPGGSTGGGEPSKRPREIGTARLANTIATTSSGGMEAVNFPSEVSSPAVFRCVRVSPMDEADDEYAYQTAVSIGGHVFKGILYDQGPETQYPISTTPRGHLHHGDHTSSSGPAGIATAAAIASSSATSSAAASTGLLDPSLYPTPLSAFMAGTQFFPHHPRP